MTRVAPVGVSGGHAMHARDRIEQTLDASLKRGEARDAPPRLASAVRHAVMPGGARIRPQLCLAVAAACGDPVPALTNAAAASIELLHCASLVHDDLPCFDAALLRRGRPSVHAAFGERCAVLAGDALIVLAFETLAAGAVAAPHRLPSMMAALAARVGMPRGIVAGQAWECEDWVTLPDYHRAKTGSLFAAATELGALAAGADGGRWRGFGEWLGEAYQVADDIRDAACDVELIGKPAGRDRTLGRPSAVTEFGLAGALAYFDRLVGEAGRSIPEGPGARPLRHLLLAETERLLPASVRAATRTAAPDEEVVAIEAA
jgi:geranylgeranyl diphosphate synthase type II